MSVVALRVCYWNWRKLKLSNDSVFESNRIVWLFVSLNNKFACNVTISNDGFISSFIFHFSCAQMYYVFYIIWKLKQTIGKAWTNLSQSQFIQFNIQLINWIFTLTQPHKYNDKMTQFALIFRKNCLNKFVTYFEFNSEYLFHLFYYWLNFFKLWLNWIKIYSFLVEQKAKKDDSSSSNNNKQCHSNRLYQC